MSKSRASDAESKHEMVVGGICEMLKPILEGSSQPIFLYLDDNHKACNKRFARMLGYPSCEEFSAVKGNFLRTFVDEGSHEMVLRNYTEDIRKNLSAAVTRGAWKKRDGGTVKTTVITAPLPYEGHLMVIGFVTKME